MKAGPDLVVVKSVMTGATNKAGIGNGNFFPGS